MSLAKILEGKSNENLRREIEGVNDWARVRMVSTNL
jgi:hypothetical protein